VSGAHEPPTDRLSARLAVVEAVILATERREEILDAIAEAHDPEEARRVVAAILGIGKDTAAAEAVIELRLRRFSRSQVAEVRGEAESIREVLRDRGL
jgi:DNA gyrase/topoisomerase IV subunit A